jgi:hypothetical protein
MDLREIDSEMELARLCSIVSFCIDDVEPSCSASRNLVNYTNNY